MNEDKPLSEEAQRLEFEVVHRMNREDERRVNRGEYMHERVMEGVVSVAEALKPAVDRLTAMAEETKRFSEWLWPQVEALSPDMCDDHDMPMRVDRDKTFADSWYAKRVVVTFICCEKCLEERQRLLGNEKIKKMGIPDKVLHAKFDNFNTDSHPSKIKALNKVRKQVERGSGFLILRGFFGTGKSHLGAAAIREKGDGIFVTLHDLVGELRKTYSDNSDQEKMVDKYRQTPVLVLDELSLEVKGSDIASLLYRIFAHRYDRGLLTIITSNETLETILSILGGRLADRIKESYQVATMEWESHRKQDVG